MRRKRNKLIGRRRNEELKNHILETQWWMCMHVDKAQNPSSYLAFPNEWMPKPHDQKLPSTPFLLHVIPFSESPTLKIYTKNTPSIFTSHSIPSLYFTLFFLFLLFAGVIVIYLRVWMVMLYLKKPFLEKPRDKRLWNLKEFEVGVGSMGKNQRKKKN